MAARLVKMDMTATTAYQMARLQESGMVYQTALKELAKITGKSEATLQALFEKAGVKSIAWDDKVYRAAGLHPIPLQLSSSMLNVLMAGLEKTGGVVKNLTMTTALSAQSSFVDAADTAYMQVTQGAMSYDQAIRAAVKNVAAQGLSVIQYPSGAKSALDVAMRRSVLSGVGATTGQIQIARADDMNCDLVAVSAHMGARNRGEGPQNHESWQGKVYSRSGTNPKYENFYDVTGYGTGEGLGGWNCVLEGTLVSSLAKRAAYRREYSGKIVIIHTAGGKELSATPNHPILTDRGWVAAGLLELGDYVICRSRTDGLLYTGPDVDQSEARIEDVFNSFCISGARFSLPVSACHFHGDVSDGKVEVVFPDGFLGYNIDLFTEQELIEIGLGLPSGFSKPLVSECPRPQVGKGALHAPDSIVSGLSKFLASFRRRSFQSLSHGIGTVIRNWNTKFSKILSYSALGYAGLGGNFVFPHPGIVHGEQVFGPDSEPAFDIKTPVVSSVNPASSQTINNRMGRAVEVVGDELQGFTGTIELDNIVLIERKSTQGSFVHVYNLQTEGEWYSANGIITHNCRHSFYPFFEGLSQNAYSESDVSDMNDATVTLPNGNEVSQYDASQVQRNIERHIRDFKRQRDALDAASLDSTEETAKVKDWQAAMREFISSTGLSRQSPREQI
jgi:hypothetical protein